MEKNILHIILKVNFKYRLQYYLIKYKYKPIYYEILSSFLVIPTLID